MHFQIEAGVYHSVINKLKSCLDKSSDNEILSYYLHIASNDGLLIVASSMINRAEFFINNDSKRLNIIENGSCAIVGDKLLNITKLLDSNNMINVFYDEKLITNKSVSLFDENINYQIVAQESSLYPMNEFVANANEATSITISPSIFKYILKRVEICSQFVDNNFPFTSNIFISVNDKKILSCGLTNIIVSYIEIDNNGLASGSGDICIPIQYIKDLISHLDEINDIKIISDNKLVIINQLNFTTYYRLVSYSYYEWKNKFNEIVGNDYFIVNSNVFKKAIKRISVSSPIINISNLNNFIYIRSVFDDDNNTTNKTNFGVEKLSANFINGNFNVNLSSKLLELVFDKIDINKNDNIKIMFSNVGKKPVVINIDNQNTIILSRIS